MAITFEQRQSFNKELDCNLESMPTAVAFLIYRLQTFQDYKLSKRKDILEQAINMLREGAQS